jgi:predicted TIM-barrel fold metal-dependent hydrolase
MIDEDVFVLDAVSHSYNLDPSNYAIEKPASMLTELVCELSSHPGLASSQLSREQIVRDWKVEETAKMLFQESDTDISTFHPTPIYFFKDGMTSPEKGIEAQKKYPNRFMTYASVDPLRDGAMEELERQAKEMDPIGLKLYQTSWADSDEWNDHTDWKLDDPSIVYPLYEKAKELGIKTVATHKSIPLGPYPMDPFEPGDVEAAATNFPEMNFELVHGGYAFSEEVGQQLGRYPNVYVNLENVTLLSVMSPKRFGKIMADLLAVGGENALNNILWGTGAMLTHPQPLLDAFWEYEFPDDIDTEGVTFSEIPPLDKEAKRKILGKNYANMHDLNIDELKANIEKDQFSQTVEENGLAEPYSTSLSLT